MRRLRSFAIVVGAALTLAGCTYVPTDSQPQVVPSHLVPFNLLSPVGPTTSTTSPVSQVLTSIWLIDRSGHLVAQHRSVASSDVRTGSIDALIEGPSDHESALGMTSYVAASLVVVRADQIGVVITVQLRGQLGHLNRAQRTLWSGQLVRTAAGASTDVVRVTLNGNSLPLVLPDGSASFIATSGSYEGLVAR